MKEDRITTDEIKHLALLTRINMSDEEIELMKGQMSDILRNIDILNQVDTDGVEVTAHSSGLNSVMREDKGYDSITIEDALLNAPRTEGNFIRIRAVLE
jgi:aspartyl-tRNA(Asn)/glutamyl-tRNA(Gln) amidotransferase subunit C|tara:strand:- start:277 stop:573 length:297 start_codon:yes stop_codon:yes gene_type:complete